MRPKNPDECVPGCTRNCNHCKVAQRDTASVVVEGVVVESGSSDKTNLARDLRFQAYAQDAGATLSLD